MGVEVLIKPEEISGNDLVQVFKLFCKSFGIESNERDEEFLRTQGLEALRKGICGLDYRPYMGAKFFGERGLKSIRFHGYSAPHDSNWESKDKNFQIEVEQYFGKR